MSEDDIETHANTAGTDAGASLSRDITAPTDDQGREVFHGPNAWKRAAREYEETADSFKSKEQAPRIEMVEDDRQVLKHRYKSRGDVSIAEASAEQKQQEELRKDPEYSKTIDLLDKLVEAGSDATEAETDYKAAILAAEQRLAARRMGLLDEEPETQLRDEQGRFAAQEQPAEQPPAEQPSASSAASAQPGIRLPQIEAAANRLASQYVQEFGVNRALTSEEVASLTPEQAARYIEYGQATNLLAEQAQAQSILVQQARTAEFQSYAAQQDAAFEKSVPKGVDRAELGKAAHAYLREDLGWSEQQIARMWNSDPQFRSADAQKLVMAAALGKLKESKAAEAHKQLNSRRAPLPKVQRPGTQVERASGGTTEAALVAGFEAACRSGSQKQQVAAAARLSEYRTREANKSKETWR